MEKSYENYRRHTEKLKKTKSALYSNLEERSFERNGNNEIC
jgi:hypothetical protein